MINVNSVGVLVLSVSLMACGDQASFSVGGSTYQIPGEYLVVQPSVFDRKSLDSDVGMVALTFNHDKDFSNYTGANAWLPRSSITAILYAVEDTELMGISPYFSNLIEFSIAEKVVIEFENSYRVFDGDTRIGWLAFPKLQASFDGDQVKAKWVADCIPRGGVNGSSQSRESIDIPTSCGINIKYRNAVLSLKTSEENLLNHADIIVKLVLEKMESWRIPS